MAFRNDMAMRACGHCGLKRAQLNPVANAQPTSSKGISRYFTFLACPDCAGITVVEHNGAVSVISQSVELHAWPEGEDRALDVEHLPDDVAGYYLDARRVLDAGVPDAAAVQLRRTLEAAAAHHGQDKGALVQRIRNLIKDGLVTASFGQALDLVRLVGNQGAHASDERVDHATAQRALRFTTQFLRNLFEVPEELRLAQAEAATDGAARGSAEQS